MFAAMKWNEPAAKAQVPFDPGLFAAFVPPRTPTAKDRADTKERPDDAVEPKEYEKMGDIVKDLLRQKLRPILGASP
jgi:hypothetical protein